MGCFPPARSMMLSRRCPRPTPPSKKKPSSFGPRWERVRVIRTSTERSTGSPEFKFAIPQIPHMQSFLCVCALDLHSAPVEAGGDVRDRVAVAEDPRSVHPDAPGIDGEDLARQPVFLPQPEEFAAQPVPSRRDFAVCRRQDQEVRSALPLERARERLDPRRLDGPGLEAPRD